MSVPDFVENAARKLADEIRLSSGWPKRGETHYKRPTPGQLKTKAKVDRDFDKMIERHMRRLFKRARD